MQRNIAYKRDLKYFSLLVLILFYEAISTIYTYLPPLLGFMFILFSNSVQNRKILLIFITVIYLLFFESNRDFLIFSSILFYFITIYYVEPKLNSIVKCNRCLIPILVAWIYLGYYVFINLNYFILNLEEIDFNLMIIYYILIESFLAYFLL